MSNLIEKLSNEMVSIARRDNIILNYPKHKVKNKMVNLHSYHPEWEIGETVDNNLGDYLSTVIVEWLCKIYGVDQNKMLPTTKHLYAVGSILNKGYQNATIWGSGFAYKLRGIRAVLHYFPYRKLDIRCVRGPLTRQMLKELGHSCPEVYGDPVVLMPMIYSPKVGSKLEYTIIPHISKEREIRQIYGNKHVLSMNTQDYKTVIDTICSSKIVVSSSLHGIILAEAYGIPAVFIQDRDEKFNFKYEDWYQSTGRECRRVKTIEEGLKVDLFPIEKGKLDIMKDVLVNNFPKDLWGGVSNLLYAEHLMEYLFQTTKEDMRCA